MRMTTETVARWCVAVYAAAVLVGVAAVGQAATLPAEVRIILGGNLGSTHDRYARLFAAELERRAALHTIVTQNVDGLHHAAGSSPDRIIEIHGNGTYAKCLSCGLRHEIGWVSEVIASPSASLTVTSWSSGQ